MTADSMDFKCQSSLKAEIWTLKWQAMTVEDLNCIDFTEVMGSSQISFTENQNEYQM